jgi:hypothetical protein
MLIPVAGPRQGEGSPLRYCYCGRGAEEAQSSGAPKLHFGSLDSLQPSACSPAIPLSTTQLSPLLGRGSGPADLPPGLPPSHL